MSVTMALTNQIDGWTLRDSAISGTCTLDLWTGTCFASTESADSSHVRLQISALGLIFAISHGWKFLLFFELKSFLFEFYFFELYLSESSIGSMMINTISPGSRGSLAASRPTTAALRPAALGLPWRAEIYPYCPGSQERLYIYCKWQMRDSTHNGGARCGCSPQSVATACSKCVFCFPCRWQVYMEPQLKMIQWRC